VFDGTDDYVTTNTVFNNTAGTWGVWFNPNTITNAGLFGRRLLHQSDNSGNRETNISLNNGRVTWYGYAASSYVWNLVADSPVTVNTWNQVIGTYDGSNAYLYINGAPRTSSIQSGPVGTATVPLYIGRVGFNNVGIYSGSMSNIQVYNQALTQFQVWQNFNAYKSRYGIPDIVTDGLVLNLDAGNPYSYLSGSSGTTWSNTVAVSSSISGSLQNGAVYSNGAITFDGSNDYINLPSTVPLNNVSQFSYSAFVRFTGSAGASGNAFFSYGRNSSFSDDILFGWDKASSKLFFQINSGSDGSADYSYTPTNTWVNVSVVYNGSLSTNSDKLKVYANGINVPLNFSYTVPSTTFTHVNPSCFIGGYTGFANTWYFTGNIANTQIYNRALSSDEVQQNFNALRGRYGI
jgi:hypothetical protein